MQPVDLSDLLIDLVLYTLGRYLHNFLLAQPYHNNRQIPIVLEICLFGLIGIVQNIKDDISPQTPSLLHQQSRIAPLEDNILLLDQLYHNLNSLFGRLANLRPMTTLMRDSH
jgi:hypothetical protein